MIFITIFSFKILVKLNNHYKKLVFFINLFYNVINTITSIILNIFLKIKYKLKFIYKLKLLEFQYSQSSKFLNFLKNITYNKK